MSWIRRLKRKPEQPAQPEQQPADDRLPDLEFLAVLKASLEEFAPGVTAGAELKGNSLLSPRGWAIGVTPPRHGGGRHYDLVAVPDVSLQPDVPCFLDCVVSMTADPRNAIDTWVQTSGACLLELVDQGERFADRVGPADERGVPGWQSVVSGVVAYGVDGAENQRMQGALLKANVLHRIADSFTADLESPFFNAVRVFYGGKPGAMRAEVRVNGEYHQAATAAMVALDLPEPAAFTVARYHALLLPLSTQSEQAADDAAHESADHDHGGPCGCCGGELDPERPGFELSMPQPIAELPEQERERRVRTDTGAIMVADGVGNFLKVRLPIRLQDGRTVVYLVWVALEAEVIEEVVNRVHDGTLPGHRFEGRLGNAIGPWGEQVLHAPVVLAGRPAEREGRVGMCEVVSSTQPLLAEVLGDQWPAEFVLGDRDPRLRAS